MSSKRHNKQSHPEIDYKETWMDNYELVNNELEDEEEVSPEENIIPLLSEEEFNYARSLNNKKPKKIRLKTEKEPQFKSKTREFDFDELKEE